MPELTMEQLDTKLNSIDTKIEGFIAAAKKGNDENSEKEKEKEAATKKANDEKKDEDKKEAKRAALEAAIKKAMEEEDSDKKEAAIKKAMSDYGNENNDKKKEAMSEDDKETKEHVASIITDKKLEIDNKILAAAAMTNPSGLPALKKSLDKNTFSASKKMLEDMTKIYGDGMFNASITPKQTQTAPPPYFMGSAMNPTEVDANQLNANSNVMDFSKLSSKDLLDGKTS